MKNTTRVSCNVPNVTYSLIKRYVKEGIFATDAEAMRVAFGELPRIAAERRDEGVKCSQ